MLNRFISRWIELIYRILDCIVIQGNSNFIAGCFEVVEVCSWFSISIQVTESHSNDTAIIRIIKRLNRSNNWCSTYCRAITKATLLQSSFTFDVSMMIIQDFLTFLWFQFGILEQKLWGMAIPEQLLGSNTYRLAGSRI